jgi:hypothetical protein
VTFERHLNRGTRGGFAQGIRSGQPLANFVAHLFAEGFPAGRPLLLIDIPPIEDVEIFQDRMAIARHGQNVKQFVRRTAGAGYFPTADGVGAIARRKAAEPCHVGSGQRPADRVSEILAKLFQFRACHGGGFLVWRRLLEFLRDGIAAAGCGF